MKNIGSVISLSFLVLFLLVTPVIGDDEWVKFSTSRNNSITYYNKVTIKYMTNDIVQVWTKTIFKGEDRNSYIQQIKDKGDQNKYVRNLSYDLTLNEVDCKNNMTRTLSETFYTNDGKILHHKTGSRKTKEWDYIIPDTMGEVLYNKLCK